MFGAGRIFGTKYSFNLRPFTMDFIADYLPDYSRAANEEASIFQQMMTPFGRELDDLHQQSYAFVSSLSMSTVDPLEQDWIYVHEMNILKGESLRYDRGALIPPTITAVESLDHFVNQVGQTEFEVESVEIVSSYRDFVSKASPSRFVGSGIKVARTRAELVGPTPILGLSSVSPIDLPEPKRLIVMALSREEGEHNLISVEIERSTIGETEILISGLDAARNKITESVRLLNTMPHSTKQKFHRIESLKLIQAPLDADDSIVIRTIHEKDQPIVDISRQVRIADDVFTNPVIKVDQSHGDSRWPKLEELVSERNFEFDLMEKKLPSLVTVSDALVLMPADPDEPNSAQELPFWIDVCIPARGQYIAGLGMRDKDLEERKILVAMWPKQTTSPTVFDDGTAVLKGMSQSDLIPECNFFAKIYDWSISNTDQAQDQHRMEIPISIELDTPRGLFIVDNWTWSIRFPNGIRKYIGEDGALIDAPFTNRANPNDTRPGIRQNDFEIDLSVAYSDLLDWRDPSSRMLVRNHCILELSYTTDDGRTETVKKLLRLPIRSAEFIYSDIERLTEGDGLFQDAGLKSDGLRVLYNISGEGHLAVATFTSRGLEYVDLVERFDKALLDTRDNSIILREEYKYIDIDFTGGV